MPRTNSLSLQTDDEPEVGPAPRGTPILAVVAALLALAVASLGWLALSNRGRTAALERQVAALQDEVRRTGALARQADTRATASENAALAAAQGRQAAEAQTATALQESEAAKQEKEAARQEADLARETAAKAQAEAERIQKRAEAEVNRLEGALGQIAETRRTALGLVMNLGGDHLKFEFNKAELQTSDKELLSRIAGILLTSHDYTVSVNGHTDDVGSAAYNQKLSERRAQAVRDYLVKAGLPPEILSVEGHGKSRPLVPGTSDAARAKNRRVELGLVNTQIQYQRPR
jgi:outer membrane protein OmpA-like peptidoglycan-associated protein